MEGSGIEDNVDFNSGDCRVVVGGWVDCLVTLGECPAGMEWFNEIVLALKGGCDERKR